MKARRYIALGVAGGITGFVLLAAILCHRHYPPRIEPAVKPTGQVNVASIPEVSSVDSIGQMNVASVPEVKKPTPPEKELDPNELAEIFRPSKSKKTRSTYEMSGPEASGTGVISKKGHVRSEARPPLPKDWESFDKQYAPEPKPGRPIVTLLENGTYQVDELLYSIKLLEKQMNFEYRLNNLVNYDPRTKENAFDSILDSTSMKTDVRLDSPVGAYIGVRMVIKFW